MSDLSRLELQRITEVAYVPDAAARQQLYEKAALAEAARAAGEKTSLLLSKMADKPFAVPAKLVGVNGDGTIDPNATVLATVGRKTGEVGDTNVLTVMNDRDIPLMATSFGANGVLTDCQHVYGTNRINLFYQDEVETLRLLSDYLQMRDQNSGPMLAMFVKKLRAHKAAAYAIDVVKPAALDPERQAVYDSLIELFEGLHAAMSTSGVSLASVGLGIRSFCQTWMRDGVSTAFLEPTFVCTSGLSESSGSFVCTLGSSESSGSFVCTNRLDPLFARWDCLNRLDPLFARWDRLDPLFARRDRRDPRDAGCRRRRVQRDEPSLPDAHLRRRRCCCIEGTAAGRLLRPRPPIYGNSRGTHPSHIWQAGPSRTRRGCLACTRRRWSRCTSACWVPAMRRLS